MITLLSSPSEIGAAIAARARAVRLNAGLTQRGLAARTGVSYASLRKFEQTGQIALLSLIKVAIALNVVDEFAQLFPPNAGTPSSLDEIVSPKRVTKRGRIT